MTARVDTQAAMPRWEWNGADSEWDPRCPACRAFQDDGHSPDCQLVAIVNALRFYAALGVDEIPYHDTINDPPDVGRTARAAFDAADGAGE